VFLRCFGAARFSSAWRSKLELAISSYITHKQVETTQQTQKHTHFQGVEVEQTNIFRAHRLQFEHTHTHTHTPQKYEYRKIFEYAV
jgi:hypothetical protein